MDPNLLTPQMIADFLLDPSKVGPGIFIVIEEMDKALKGLQGRTKLILAWAFAILAPVAGVTLRVWIGVQALDPFIVVALIVALANVTLAIKVHDLLDTPKTEATEEAMRAEMERIISEKMTELFAVELANRKAQAAPQGQGPTTQGGGLNAGYS